MSSSPETIDVRDLQPGMFVHLDLSWIAHPFPRSSFLIGSQEQIAVIRDLGLKQVRWDPARSRLRSPEADAPPAQEPPGPDEAAREPREPAFLPERAADTWGIDAAPGPAPDAAAGLPAAAPQAAAATAAAPTATAAPVPGTAAVAQRAEELQRREWRQTLAAQRTAQQQCERRFGEAVRGWRDVGELLRGGDPVAARERSEQVCEEMLERMLSDPESCIRLLTEGAGDRSSVHALNVSVISMLLGRVMALSEAELRMLGQAALLHDIGKIYLPERVRTPDDQFTPTEHKLYREHVALGVLHGRRMGLSAEVLLVIAQHHELADGSGFPQKLELARLTPAACIVGLVNRYDNLCNPALPANALTPHEALSLLFAQGKAKYDLRLLSAFVRMLGVYPPGSVVQLTDDRYALVSSVNSARPLKPRVLVHDPEVPRDEALILDLEQVPGLGIRRSLRPTQLPMPVQQYLCPHPRVAWFFDAGPASQEPAA